jgi:hypothetical protein
VAKELGDQGCAVIVLGDFNDYDPDVPDHIGSQPISNVLRIVKRMRPQDDSDNLFNVAELIPKARRYTAFWDQDEDGIVDHPKEHTSIDHILISPSLRSMVYSVDVRHDHDPIKVSDHYPIVLQLKLDGVVEPPTTPTAPSASARVIIVRLVPNPVGDENMNEEVVIRNMGTAPVDMAGCVLRDLARKTWKLDSLGVLNPGEVKSIKRNGQEMALNNGGDTIELVDKSGTLLDSITYDRVEEGEDVSR